MASSSAPAAAKIFEYQLTRSSPTASAVSGKTQPTTKEDSTSTPPISVAISFVVARPVSS